MRSKNKPAMTVLERAWVALVKRLQCSVCDQAGPCDAHEINQGQWFTSIALCKDCHQGSHNGLHGERAMWKVMKLDELGALNVTIRRIFSAIFPRIRG